MRRAAQSLRELLELILGDEQAAQRAVLFLEQETTQRARGAAGGDAAHRRERVDARHQRRERFLDAAAQAARFASAHRVGGRELAVQASDAQAECLLEAQLRGVADRELETAAAEVEAERGLFAQTDAAAKRREDQARLFLPRQDPHVRVQCAAELLGELAAVLRVAQRGGRDRQRLLRARALGHATQAARRVDRALARLGRNQSVGSDRRAEAQHLALARHPLHVTVRRRVGDEHVERRAAQIRHGDAHALAFRARAERMSRRRKIGRAQRLAERSLEHPRRSLRHAAAAFELERTGRQLLDQTGNQIAVRAQHHRAVPE